jgi:SAM-dependent methyltransferase
MLPEIEAVVMSHGYREELFQSYASTHSDFVNAGEELRLKWFEAYAQANYFRLVDPLDRSATRILEIGCGRGYLLAYLSQLDFENLAGIDLSSDDIEAARNLVPQADLQVEDAADYLKTRGQKFDVIIFKAVLEHIPKDEIFPFLSSVKSGLNPGGTVIIDVPNMDWIFAHHERYMDFTHEVGFTRESLGQVLRNRFDEVEVHKGAFIQAGESRKARLFRPLAIALLNNLFVILGEGVSEIWWDCRSIIAVARKSL